MTSVSAKAITLVVNGQEVCIRAQTSGADHWYSVTANGKAVCLTPFHSDMIITHVTDGMQTIVEVLYKMWADRVFPTTEDELLTDVTTLTGFQATDVVTTPVSYVEVSSFVDAIDLILEATSEA